MDAILQSREAKLYRALYIQFKLEDESERRMQAAFETINRAVTSGSDPFETNQQRNLDGETRKKGLLDAKATLFAPFKLMRPNSYQEEVVLNLIEAIKRHCIAHRPQ